MSATLIMTLVTHVPLILMSPFSHFTAIFTYFSSWSEVFPTIVITVFHVDAMFPVAKLMDSCNIMPTEFAREFSLPHLYPVTAIMWCTVPAAAPVNVVTAGNIKHVVGYAHSHAKAQLGRIKKIGWLCDDDRRPSYIDSERNVSSLSH